MPVGIPSCMYVHVYVLLDARTNVNPTDRRFTREIARDSHPSFPPLLAPPPASEEWHISKLAFAAASKTCIREC